MRTKASTKDGTGATADADGRLGERGRVRSGARESGLKSSKGTPVLDAAQRPFQTAPASDDPRLDWTLSRPTQP